MPPKAGRILALSLTGVIAVIGLWEVVFLVRYIASQDAIGIDQAFYRTVGQRWLDTGVYYLPHQLAGPYLVTPEVDVLYPPIALMLFVPLVWTPFPLWWIMPAIVFVYAGWRLRPTLWTWPIIVFLMAWPRSISNVIYGNSDMWILTFIAAGVLIAWPAVLVFIKPSVLPLAFIGSRRRSWWVAFGVLALISIPMLALWRDFFVVIRNSDARWYYSLDDLPPLFIPIVAWLGRRGGGYRTTRELVDAIRLTRIRIPLRGRPAA